MTLTCIILTVLLVMAVLLAGAFAYACFNLVKKVEFYEDWSEKFQTEVAEVYNRMKAVDEQNLFEKDDDVGWVFSELVRISKEFAEAMKINQ